MRVLPALPRRLRMTALLVVVAMLPIACGGGRGGDDTADPVFFIASSYPADGQQNIPVDAVLTVTCNRPLDPASVNWQSIRVGVIGGIGEIQGQAVLDSQNTRQIRWTPNGQLVPTDSHACEVSPALRSEDGDLVEGDLLLTFRTAGPLPGPDLPDRDNLTELLGRMKVGRREHTATLLQSGFVLITGGFRQGTNVTDSAERYFAGSFQLLTKTMVLDRAGHTATRLADGRVLLTGGWYEQSLAQLASTATAEIYDPTTGEFTSVGPMTYDRVDHAAALLPDGRVLVAGGTRWVAGSPVDLDSADVFDPATETFSELTSRMSTVRYTHVMEDMGNGRILVHGGSSSNLRPDIFDAATDQFAPILPALQDESRFGAAAAAFDDGDICVAGGDTLGTVLHVDSDPEWISNTGSGLSAPRGYATATRYAPDRILVVGGYDLRYSLFLLNNCDVVIQGGITGSRTYGCDMRFPTGMVGHTATRLLDGTILLCGGLNVSGGEPELDTAYVFTP